MTEIIDFFTQIANILSTVITIVIETFNAVWTILCDIPEYIQLITVYLDMMPGPAKVFGAMMLFYVILFTVIKVINLVVPFM